MKWPKFTFMSPGWVDRAANTFFQTLVATVAVVSPQSWPEWSSVLITAAIAAGMSVARSGSNLPGVPIPVEVITRQAGPYVESVTRPLENVVKTTVDEGQRWVDSMFGGKR